MTATDAGPVEVALADAERDVLSVVLYAGRVPDATRALTAEDFGNHRWRAVWSAIRALDDRGEAVDPSSVAIELGRRHDKAVRVDRASLLAIGNDAVPTALPTYVEHVQEAAERRRWREQGTRLMQASQMGDLDSARQHAATAARELVTPPHARPRSGLVVRDLADIAREHDALPPRQLLFDPVWPAGDYGVLSAEAKAGKTWALADAAISCATGMPWLGQFPTFAEGPVVMYAGEGGAAKILRRLRAVAASKGLGRDLDDIPVRLSLAVPRLTSADHIALVTAELEASPARLVILDPFYLAASGAKGSDLYAMGDVLYAIQAVVQDAGAALLVAHHWNKTGRGGGHDRSSGVGPGAWGRVLVSVAVDHARTDTDDAERPGMTTVRQTWSFTGDEISDPGLALIRRVWAEDQHDLNSPLHYELERTEPRRARDATPEGATAGSTDRLTPAERKVLDILTGGEGGLTARQIGDRYADLHGNGLKRETLSRALNRLQELDHAQPLDETGERGAKYWVPLLAERPVQTPLPTCDEE